MEGRVYVGRGGGGGAVSQREKSFAQSSVYSY